MGFLSGLVGAVGGLVTGGPVGAIAGGVGGFLSNDSDQPQTMRQGYDLREYTPEERAAIEQAQRQLMAAMQEMTPAQRERYISELAGSYYEPMAREINNSMAGALGRSNANQARGGMRGSSSAIASDEQIARTGAGLLGQARADARRMGEESFFRRQADRRADIGTSLGIMDSMSGRRRADSTQVSAGMPFRPSGVSSGMSMIGYGITSPDSYFNRNNRFKDIFGGV